MIDGISLSLFAALTPSALLSLTVVLILMGRLVPKSTLDRQVRETEKWEKAYQLAEEGRTLSDKQNTELLETAKATHNILIALFPPQRGGPHVVQTPTKKGWGRRSR